MSIRDLGVGYKLVCLPSWVQAVLGTKKEALTALKRSKMLASELLQRGVVHQVPICPGSVHKALGEGVIYPDDYQDRSKWNYFKMRTIYAKMLHSDEWDGLCKLTDEELEQHFTSKGAGAVRTFEEVGSNLLKVTE